MGHDEHPGILLPEDWELIGFFECEPTLAYEEISEYGWQYNSLTFTTHRGGDHVCCTIDPSYGEMSIDWTRDGVRLVHLKLCYGKSLTVHSEGGRESMRVEFQDSSYLLPLVLQLKPTVQIEWGATRWIR